VILIALLALQIMSIIALQPADRFTHEKAYYLVHASSTLARNENRPQSFQVEILPNWEPKPRIATGEGTIPETTLWTGSHRIYQVEALSDVVVVEPTVYFAGWRTTIDGKVVPIDQKVQQGLIAFAVPARPGQPYQIDTRTSENTTARKIGDVLSGISLLGWLVWFLGAWKKR
jgi:hypothetical protein